MTWYNDIPQPLLDLLSDFELHGIGESSIFKDRHHILLDEATFVQSDGYNLMKAIPLIPEGVNREMYQMKFFPKTTDRVMHSLPLTIVFEKEITVKPKKLLIWNAKDAMIADEIFPMPVHWIFDSQSICIPIQQEQQDQIHVLEMFSGGYGGWSFAQRFLRSHFQIPLRIVSIEEDFEAAKNHSFNHDTTLVGANGPHDDLLQQTDFDVTIHGDIRSQQWWETVAKWGVDGFTISAPCGPWSGASFSPGLHSISGMLFPESLILARIFRPKWILLENVVGFKHHNHMKFCVAILNACNYRMLWSKEIDAAEFGSSHRHRWLGLAVSNTLCSENTRQFEMWPKLLELTPEKIDAIFMNPPDASELVVKQIMQSFAHEWILLPPQDKPALRHATGQQIFQSRCFNKKQQHPTFMAQYGSQHEMSRNQMEIKGYYAHFFQHDDGTCRLLHPSEIAMIHLHWDRILISHEMKQGWKHVGNMITIPHALLMTANVYKICYDIQIPTVGEIFHKFLDARLMQQNIRQFSGKYATVFVDQLQQESDRSWMTMIDNYDSLTDTMKDSNLQQQVWRHDSGIKNIEEFLHIEKCPTSQISIPEHQFEEMTPTQHFVPFMKAQIDTDTAQGNFWVAADVEKETLQKTYEGHFEIQTMNDETNGIHFKLKPGMMIELHEDVKSLTTCICERNLSFMKTDCEQPILRQMVMAGFNDKLFDQFGPIEENMKPYHGMIVADFQIATDQKFNPLFLMAAWKNTETSFVWKSSDLSWACSIQGEFQACLTVEFFWFTLIRGFQDNLGIVAEIVQNQVGRNILFKMNHEKIPLPPDAFWMTIAVMATRSFLNHLSCKDGIHIAIKLCGKVLWHGFLPKEFNLLIVSEAIGFTMQPIYKSGNARLVGKGKNWYDITIEQLQNSFGSTPITLHMMNSLTGGVGTKENQKVHVRNSLASTLLEQGFDIQWVSNAIDSIMKKCGSKVPMQTAQLPPSKQRVDTIMQLCKDAAVEIPPKVVKDATAVAKAGATNQQKRKVVIQPSPDDYQIQPGFLQNEDGTEVNQIKEISSNASGILLINKEKAVPWLREGQILSTDELAIAIIGADIEPTSLQTSSVNIPCWDQKQQSVILHCQLVQLGEKKIMPKIAVSQQVPHEECTILAMTIWKEDWESKKWEMALDSTNAFFRQEWKQQNLDEGILAIWGKSLRQNKNPTTPMYATSMQVHCSVKNNFVAKMMRASGFNQIFLVPKDDKGRINQDFRVIWIEGEVAHLTVQAAKTNKCQGMVKVKSTLGLRYHKDDFESAWKTIYPGKDTPIDTKVNHIYRIEPLPYGSTSDMLVKWSATVQWPLKPIKAAGPKSWIIGATSHPTQQVLVFNGQPILAKLIPPKQHSQVSPIVAGPKPSIHSQKKSDPFQTNDPWAKFQPTSSSIPPHQPRDVAGPTEAKFQQQESRILQVEQALQQLQNETKAGFADVEKREKHFQDALHKDLHAMRNDIDKSVQSAMMAQSNKLDSTLSELKSLFAQTAKRTREQQRSEDKDFDEAMDSPQKTK